MKELIIIAAAGANNALGKNNKLLWHLPEDFKHFKQTTMGAPMLMGRKTFESLPGVLPNRKHIIITRDLEYTVPHQDCTVVHSIDQAIELVKDANKAFIIGGGQLYEQCMVKASKIILTRVHQEFEADTFFPEIDTTLWEVTTAIDYPKDDRNPISFSIETYQRR